MYRLPDNPVLTFGDIFAGIGGFALGFQRAGMQPRWFIEKEDYCRKVLAKHWPGVTQYGDVRNLTGCELEQVDVVCGGDPCQENSNARQVGHVRQPSLGGEFIRIVDVLRPRIVVRENPTATRKDAPWPWWRFRAELERLGYAVLPFRLRACCLGADHRRDRLFLLAELTNPLRPGLPLGSQASTDQQNASGLPAWTGFAKPLAVPRIGECDPSVWGGNLHGIPGRVDRIRALGNAVVPQAAEFIGRMIVEKAGYDSAARA